MFMSFASPPEVPSDVSSDMAHDRRDEVRDEVRATLTALMPWGVSILFHIALIVLAFFLVWQTIIPGDEQQPNAPTLARTPDARTPSEQKIDEPAAASASSSLLTPITPANVEVKPPMPGFELPPITLPVPNDGLNDWKQGTGTGKNDGPFGVGDSDKDGERGEGGSNRVVFVVDASGSMVDVLPFVVSELKRVVNTQINKDMQATVLFFSGTGVSEMPGPKGLRRVDNDFKARFRDWVTLSNHRYDTGGRGSAYVREALTRALGYKPDVVYLLSDNLTGGGQGATRHELFQDELLALIRDQNDPDSPARISTVQFLYEDPLVRAGLKGTLQRIADDTGGDYKFIGERDLKLR